MAARPSGCQDKRMEKQDKAERLAAALRENLKRRKAQAREGSAAADAGGQSERHSASSEKTASPD